MSAQGIIGEMMIDEDKLFYLPRDYRSYSKATYDQQHYRSFKRSYNDQKKKSGSLDEYYEVVKFRAKKEPNMLKMNMAMYSKGDKQRFKMDSKYESDLPHCNTPIFRYNQSDFLEYLPSIELSIFQSTFCLPNYDIFDMVVRAPGSRTLRVDNICRTFIRPNKTTQWRCTNIRPEEADLYIPVNKEVLHSNQQNIRPILLSEAILLDAKVMRGTTRNFFLFPLSSNTDDKVRRRGHRCSEFLRYNKSNVTESVINKCIQWIWNPDVCQNTSWCEFTSLNPTANIVPLLMGTTEMSPGKLEIGMPPPSFRLSSTFELRRKISDILRRIPITYHGRALNYLPIERLNHVIFALPRQHKNFIQIMIHARSKLFRSSVAVSLLRPTPQITLSTYSLTHHIEGEKIESAISLVSESAEPKRKKARIMVDSDDFLGLDFMTLETSANTFFQTRDNNWRDCPHDSTDDTKVASDRVSGAHDTISDTFPAFAIGNRPPPLHTILVSGDHFDSSSPLFRFIVDSNNYGLDIVDVGLARPVDIIVDSLSCICVLHLEDLKYKSEALLRELASQCQKFQNIGILLIGLETVEGSSNWTESLAAFYIKVSMFPCKIIVRQVSSISKVIRSLHSFIVQLREQGASQGATTLVYSAEKVMMYQYLEAFPSINMYLACEVLRRNDLKDLVRDDREICCIMEGLSQFSRTKIQKFMELSRLHVGLTYSAK